MLLLARCIAALSTLISYVASGPELIASCVLRFSPTASSFAPSLAFPCSHLTSLCLSVRVYISPSLQDSYSVRSVLTRLLPSSHISFSIVAVPMGLLVHIVPPKLNVELMGHPTGRIVHFCAGYSLDRHSDLMRSIRIRIYAHGYTSLLTTTLLS